jgi:glycosyltransferase involved in cell wall biosynthesis/GT2 family glycosyltransferase
MNVSIVINTYNRGAKLRECLRNLRHLKYNDFEVVVVNGPSTDETEAVCREAGDAIKYCRCPEVNLSMSRNIGIAAAAGEICAFIDDDALTHPSWLNEITAHYESPKVVGVGGYTLDNTGTQYQATATLCDRLGQDYGVANSAADTFCFPGSPLYPSLLGTNSSFRRAALLEIGGFDETFAYFLDETDVCLRLIDQGGIIRYTPKAIIYHRFAPSHLRTVSNVPKTRFMPIRSKAYFMLRHGQSLYTKGELATKIEQLRTDTKRDDSESAKRGKMTASALSHLNHEVDRAIEEAYRLAQLPAAPPLAATAATPSDHSSFKTYPVAEDTSLRIAFISRGFPPGDTNGIARWTWLLARGLAESGHQVHVITMTKELPSTSYEDGLWLHKISPHPSAALEDFLCLFPIPSEILRWSAAAYEELQNIGFENLNVVSAPIWDAEGLVTQILAPIPVVTSLHTTYKLAAPHKPDWQKPVFNHNHVQSVAAAERFLFECSPWLLGNSQAIVEDIEGAYGVNIAARTRIVPHGVEDVDSSATKTSEDPLSVLFVGRQETRKGFDTAIAAAIQVCRNRPDVEFRFVGSPCDDATCVQAVSTIPQDLSGRIQISGHVGEDQLHAAYRACDVFIAPSRYESFGLIAIEAMRYGKPVIAGDRGGLREVVRHEVNGLLVDPDSPDSLARAIELLLGNPELGFRLGHAARETFVQNFTVQTMVRGAEAAYADFANLRTY